MRYLLYHTPEWRPDAIQAALTSEQIDTREIPSVADLPAVDHPAALILGAASLAACSAEDLARVWRCGAAPVGFGPPVGESIPVGIQAERLSSYLTSGTDRRTVLIAIRTALRESATRLRLAVAERSMAARAHEVAELTDIGIKLTVEKDYRTLLDMILRYARRVTQSDAGSLYLVEASENGERRLRFVLTQNESLPNIDFQESTMPCDHTSLAGHVAVDGEPLVIDDVYHLPAEVTYTFNKSFDIEHGYRTRSMLVIPMPNHQGEVIGVLQLINHTRKPEAMLPTDADVDTGVAGYSAHLVGLARALASQGAVALENGQLYQAIEHLFDGFVLAAVTAIEQRDPVTSGHSERVAGMTVRLAQVVSDLSTGPYSHVVFHGDQLRELRYAALLHDFGKVGVREHVLVKEKKLYQGDLDVLRQRHAFLVRTAQWQFEKARANHLEKYGRDGYEQLLPALRAAQAQEFADLDRFLTTVVAANEPSVLPEETQEDLQGFAQETYRTLDGRAEPLLSERELRFLNIPKGTLDEMEREELEGHVHHTFEFLRCIPWTSELQEVPDIAYGHHEKMDGTGYPRGVPGDAIAPQTRMMTLADIFDALTAMDRPYKPALSTSRALDIMRADVEAGGLDPDLFDIFVKARVYDPATA